MERASLMALLFFLKIEYLLRSIVSQKIVLQTKKIRQLCINMSFSN